MRKLLAPIAFFAFLMAGHWVSVDSWGGAVFVYLGEQRSPAAVRSIRDYSVIDRKALFSSLHKQLLEGARLVKQDGYVGLTLGNPLVKAARGTKEFACAIQGRPGMFDRMELTFLGAGISEAGRQPKMTVEADCSSGMNLTELETIWVPMHDIVTAAAIDQELQIFGDRQVIVRLEQIPGEWPPSWVLWNVRLYRSANPEEGVSVDNGKIRETNPKLFSFSWE